MLPQHDFSISSADKDAGRLIKTHLDMNDKKERQLWKKKLSGLPEKLLIAALYLNNKDESDPASS